MRLLSRLLAFVEFFAVRTISSFCTRSSSAYKSSNCSKKVRLQTINADD
eukprot:UN10462